MTLSMGLVATTAALVLGLLISSAKSFYDAQSAELTQMSAKIVLLDRLLAHYGPEAKDAREALRAAVAGSIDRIWPDEHTRASELLAPSTGAENVLVKIEALSPQDDTQRSLRAQSLNLTIDLAQTRWLIYEQGANSVSTPMIVTFVFWLVAIFFSFGLFAPRNATVIAALMVAAMSVSGAIFLILEMYSPFEGLIRISSAPLRTALLHLGQ
ncbi:MAG: hypothetical protein ACLPHI_15290 [Terriglobales bacterium]